MTEDEKKEGSGYFPFEYYESFLKFIDRNKQCIEILTYNDIDWCGDYNHENAYEVEWKNWNNKLKKGQISRDKIYLLIQHDVDTAPFLTTKKIECEQKYGVKSNIMLFNQRVNRRHLQQTGELLFDDKYPAEIEVWKKYEKQGFVFCYHANSYEQANFDREKAGKIFESDVLALRKKFNINFFSPHGGARCPEKLSNTSIEIPDSLKNDIRWVANGATLRFNGVFSDGGPNSKSRDPNKRDLKDFVSSWEPGKRYRVITHPQYYITPCGTSPRLVEAKWYRDMMASYSEQGSDYWSDASFSDIKKTNDQLSKITKLKRKMSRLLDASYLKRFWK